MALAIYTGLFLAGLLHALWTAVSGPLFGEEGGKRPAPGVVQARRSPRFLSPGALRAFATGAGGAGALLRLERRVSPPHELLLAVAAGLLIAWLVQRIVDILDG